MVFGAATAWRVNLTMVKDAQTAPAHDEFRI
jgi:hypothetical protein